MPPSYVHVFDDNFVSPLYQSIVNVFAVQSASKFAGPVAVPKVDSTQSFVGLGCIWLFESFAYVGVIIAIAIMDNIILQRHPCVCVCVCVCVDFCGFHDFIPPFLSFYYITNGGGKKVEKLNRPFGRCLFYIHLILSNQFFPK